MNCRSCQKNLSALADNALSPREQSQMRAHLASCVECRKELEELIALKRLLGQLEVPETRQGFWASVYVRIAATKPRAKAAYLAVRRVRIAGVAIAAAALGFAVIYSEQLNREDRPDQPASTVQPATFDPATLVSLHASVRATRPLADTGKIRYAISEGNARDYANDDTIDSR
jgi:anti-sigma factor RsiW